MDVSEFVVAALLLELTPGPNMVYLATLSLAQGRVPGFVATAGVAFGLAVHAIFAAARRGSADPAVPAHLRGASLDRRCLSPIPRMGRLANPSGNLAGPR
jgi:hypothetical protein